MFAILQPSVPPPVLATSALPTSTFGAARESALGASAGAALAGGINMMLSAGTTFMFKRAGMLSADGRCKALDKAGKYS
jgi:hypothetical protein